MTKQASLSIFKKVIYFVVFFLLITNFYGADPEVKFESFNKNSFDQVFSRADRLGDMLQWQQAVESGKKAITARWEADAVKKIEEILKLQPDNLKKTVEDKLRADMAVAKTSWEAGSDQEIINRKIKYISKKSDIPLIKVNTSLIKKALKDAALNNNTDNFNTDLSGWDSSLTSLRSTQRADVVTTLNNKINQLKSSSGLTGSTLAKYHDLLYQKADNVLIDWDLQADYLIIRDRNRFVAKRLYDRNSLKLASEKTSAEYIINSSIVKAKTDATKLTSDFLKNNGAQDSKTPGLLDLSNMGEEWQSKIEKAVNVGLNRWKTAHEDILNNFMSWQSDAQDSFNEGNAKWELAYKKISDEKTKWLTEIKKQIEDGVKAWSDKEQDSLQNRVDAENRLDEYIKQQQSEWDSYSGQLNSLFSQGSSAISTARKNIEWLKPIIYDYLKTGILFHGFNPNHPNAPMYIFYTNELARWQKIEADFKNMTDTALDRFHYGDMWQGTAGMSMMTNQNDAYLYSDPEFNYEKSKREIQYWSNRLEIALSVYSYATNESANRQTAEQTRLLLEQAKTGMQDAKLSYTNALYQLNVTVTSNLSVWQTNLSVKNEELLIAQSNFQAAKTEYDNKLYFLRLLENATNSEDILNDLNQNFVSYESARMGMHNIQSNLVQSYVSLQSNERVYGYVDILNSTISNQNRDANLYNEFLSITSNMADLSMPEMEECGYQLATNLRSFVSDDAALYFGTEISNILLELNAASTSVMKYRYAFELIGLTRRIERTIASSWISGSSNVAALTGGVINLDSMYTNAMQSHWDYMENRAENNSKVLAYVYNKIYTLFRNDFFENEWLDDATLEDKLFGNNQNDLLSMYSEKDQGAYDEGDAIRYLYRWYADNRLLLEEARTNTDFSEGSVRYSLFVGLYDAMTNAEYTSSWFSTNSFEDESSISRAEDFLSDKIYEAEEKVAGFSGIAIFDKDIGDSIFDFAQKNSGINELVNNDGEMQLFNDLNNLLPDDPADIRSKNLSELKQMAQSIVDIYNNSQSTVPEFVNMYLQEIYTKIETLKKNEYLLESSINYNADTTNQLKTSFSNAKFSYDEESAKIDLTDAVFRILTSNATNTYELLQSITSNNLYLDALSSNPGNLAVLLTNADQSNRLQLDESSLEVYDTSSSNRMVIAEELTRIQYSISYFNGEFTLSSMRDYLDIAKIMDGTNKIDIDRVDYNGITADDWGIDKLTGNTTGSVFNYSVYANNTVANSVLDTVNQLADSIILFKQTVLPGYKVFLDSSLSGIQNYINSYNTFYDHAEGVTNSTAYNSFTNDITLLKTRVIANNTGNDGTLTTRRNAYQSGKMNIENSAGDVIKNGTFYYLVQNTNPADYLKSPDVLTVKNSFSNRQYIYNQAQVSYTTAKTKYDNASTEYYSSMTNTAALGKKYDVLKHEYDVRQSVYTYASTPYTAQQSDPNDQTLLSTTNSAADAQTEYMNVLSNFNTVYTRFTNAKDEYENRVTLGQLDSGSDFTDYRTKRDTYLETTKSYMRLDKGYTDMTEKVSKLKEEIRKKRDELLKNEGKLFKENYELAPGGTDVRKQLLSLIVNAGSVDDIINDFQNWSYDHVLSSSHFQEHEFVTLAMIWKTSKTAPLINPFDLSGTVPGISGNQNTYSGPNDSLYSKITSSNNMYINPDYFYQMSEDYSDLKARDHVVSFFHGKVQEYKRKRSRVKIKWYAPFIGIAKKIYYSIRVSQFDDLEEDARNDNRDPYIGATHAWYDYNTKNASPKNKMKKLFKDLRTAYSEIADLQTKINAVSRITFNGIIFENNADTSKPGVTAALSFLRNKIITEMQKYQMSGSEVQYFQGAAGLENLSKMLNDLNAMKKEARLDQFGIPVTSGGVQQYDYFVNVVAIVEQMKNMKSGARVDTLNDWKNHATSKNVDDKLFIKDKEKQLYTASANGRSMVNGREYQGYVSVVQELMGVGTTAWSIIKSQEKDLQLQKWNFKETTLSLDKQKWYATAMDIYSRGLKQWQNMSSEFNMAWQNWRKKAKKAIEKSQDKWLAVIDNMKKAQRNWLENINKAATKNASEALALSSLDMINNTINNLKSSLPGKYISEAFDPDKLADKLIKDNRVAVLSSDFMHIMDYADTSFNMSEITALSTSGALNGFQDLMDRYDKASMVMQNIQVFDMLDTTIKSYVKMINNADSSTDESLSDTLKDSGFSKSGSDWTRRAIVDATIWGAEWDTQVVPGYKKFTYNAFNYNLKVGEGQFDVSMLMSMSQPEIEGLVTAAKMQIKKQFDKLMGDDSENPQDAESFQTHIGKTPEVDNSEGKVKWETGSGQLKSVIGTMIDKNIQKQRGEAKANGPFWSKGLWDSDSDNDGESDGWFGAPSLMSVVKIAGTIAGGGPWLSFALDAFDTAFNVAAGNMELGDGLLKVAKGAATTAVGNFTGGLAKSWGASWSSSLGSDFLGSTLGKVAAAGVNQAANIAISGINLEHGWSMDRKTFKNELSGAGRSLAITTSTAIVSGAIASSYKDKGVTYGKKGWGTYNAAGRLSTQANNITSSVNSISGFWGGLAGQAMSYAVGDGFSLNLLNSDDLGLGGQGTGLLSLTLGARNKGVQNGLAVSSAGWDISSSAINQYNKAQDYFSEGIFEDVGAQHYLDYKDSKKGMARITYVDLGLDSKNANAMKTSWDLIYGDKDMAFDLEGKNNLGHADAQGNTIRMNKDAINISEDTMSKAGFYTSIMAREGYLIDRNNQMGISGLSDDQMRSSGLGAKLTREAFGVQNSVINSLANNADIQFDGVYGDLADQVDYVARTGDLSGFDATGRDWKRVKFQKQSKIKDFVSLLKTGKMGEDTLWQSEVSLEKGDTIETLYGALGIGNTSGPQAEMVKKSLIKQLKDKLPIPIDDNIDDASLNKLLGTMSPGDLKVSLNYAKSLGGYYANADLEVGRNSEWYEKGIGLVAWPAVQVGKGASWAWDQVFGGTDYAGEFLDTYKNKVITPGLEYKLGGRLTDDPPKPDCSGVVRDILILKGYQGISQWANTDWFINNKEDLGLSEIQRSELKNGDWIFFKSPDPNAIPLYRHMAVYSGNNKVYNAWEPGPYSYSNHKELDFSFVRDTHLGYGQKLSYWRPNYKKMWMRGR